VVVNVQNIVSCLPSDYTEDIKAKWEIILDRYALKAKELTKEEKSTYSSRRAEDLATVEILQREMARRRGVVYPEEESGKDSGAKTSKEIHLPDLQLRASATKRPLYNIETDYVRQEPTKEEGASNDEVDSPILDSKEQTSKTSGAVREEKSKAKQDKRVAKSLTKERERHLSLGIGATFLSNKKD
jgi:hypothetical protein